MINQEYINLFHSLIEHPENEVVEFKKAERNFDTDDLGKYSFPCPNMTLMKRSAP